VKKEFGTEDDEPVEAIYEENARNLNIRRIRPSDDLNFLLTHNHVRCGIIANGLLVDNETAGIHLSNYHTVTTLVAHLYVESQRAGFLDAKWQ
jgi:hypothetical protein